jgi:hypothetical protein
VGGGGAKGKKGWHTVSGEREVRVGAVLEFIVVQVIVHVQRRFEVDALQRGVQ